MTTDDGGGGGEGGEGLPKMTLFFKILYLIDFLLVKK